MGTVSAGTVAIADDDVAFGEYLKTFLETRGYRARVFAHGQELVASLQGGAVPDVVLLDVMMPVMDGLATLKQLKAICGDVPVIMLSGREHATTIVEALNLGAANYVVKPDDPAGLGEISLDAALKQAIDRHRPATDAAVSRRPVNDDDPQAVLVWGRSEAMRKIAMMVERVADSDVTVLIRGESGVGKELVARAIHDSSPRRTRPFVKVNCAALPDDLLESELFGHEKGSFTGASTLRIGKFEHAHQGTLMLDEIGEMKPGLQGKLLHVLQDGEFSRLGSNKRVRADVRVIAATNRHLESILGTEFREDLYYRLKVIEIAVPPLRERADELHGLIDFFVEKYARQYNRSAPTLSPALREAMERHYWPGNIRELENVVKRFVILQEESLLRFDLHAGERLRPVAAAPVTSSAMPVQTDRVPKVVPAPADTDSALSLPEMARAAMLQAERDLIIPTLHRVHWNRRKAAPLLGISYKTLLNKMKEHGIIQE